LTILKQPTPQFYKNDMIKAVGQESVGISDKENTVLEKHTYF
jgi:hypothetical protein